MVKLKSPEERRLSKNSQNLIDLLEADMNDGRNLYGNMVNVASRFIGDYQSGEDAVQSLLVRLINGGANHFKYTIKKNKGIDENPKIRPWIFRCLFNIAIEFTRRKKKSRLRTNISPFNPESDDYADKLGMLGRSVFFLSYDTPYEEAVRSEEENIIDRAIEELPVNHRTIISLYYFDGLKYREIAERLDIPKGTVKSRLSYSKGLLRRILSSKHLLLNKYESV